MRSDAFLRPNPLPFFFSMFCIMVTQFSIVPLLVLGTHPSLISVITLFSAAQPSILTTRYSEFELIFTQHFIPPGELWLSLQTRKLQQSS